MRSRSGVCFRSSLLFFCGLVAALRLGFAARLPLLTALARRCFDANAMLPFALLGGASLTIWLGLAMAIQHHPLGRRLLQRRTALGLGLVAVAAYLLDLRQQSSLFSSGVVAIVSVPSLLAFCLAIQAARGELAARGAPYKRRGAPRAVRTDSGPYTS